MKDTTYVHIKKGLKRHNERKYKQICFPLLSESKKSATPAQFNFAVIALKALSFLPYDIPLRDMVYQSYIAIGMT